MVATAMFGGPGHRRSFVSEFFPKLLLPQCQHRQQSGQAIFQSLRSHVSRSWSQKVADGLHRLAGRRRSFSAGFNPAHVESRNLPAAGAETAQARTASGGIQSRSPPGTYTDRRYRSGYTNDGNLICSWVGREALGGQAWTRYSFSPRTSVQLSYRHQEVDRFLAGGGRLYDFSLSARCPRGLSLSCPGKRNMSSGIFLLFVPGRSRIFPPLYSLRTIRACVGGD